MVQLKPSTKREIRGWAVAVNIACWFVAGGCTWSKLKTCFLLLAAEDPRAAAAELEPMEFGTLEVESMEMLVGDRALMTVL